MDQDQFKKALAKYESRKKRQAAALEAEGAVRTVKAAEPVKAVDPVMPFVEKVIEPKKEKQPEAPRPKLASLKIVVGGPVNFEMTIDYQGTLLGSQITEQYLRQAMKKALSSLGRVN